MTILSHGKTTIDLDQDGIEHLKTELDTTDEEILGALKETNTETVIGQYTQLDIILEVLESREQEYITDTDGEIAVMEIYQIGE